MRKKKNAAQGPGLNIVFLNECEGEKNHLKMNRETWRERLLLSVLESATPG
jgi:hypothetical protein